MIAALATVAGVLGLISATLVLDRRRDATLAHYVQQLRDVASEPCTYRAATDAERARHPGGEIDGMRAFGSIAFIIQGRLNVSGYVSNEDGTIVASRNATTLFVFSQAGGTAFETVRFRWGMPKPGPEVDHRWFPPHATDAQVLAAHRERIEKAAEPLVRIATIEQLAELQTKVSRQTARWRVMQDADELLESDLRSILQGMYESRGEGVKAQLGRGLPRARVMRS